MRQASAGRVLAGIGLISAGLVALLDALGGTREAARLAGRWWPASILLLVVLRASTFLGRPVSRNTRPWHPLIGLVIAAAFATALLLLTTGVIPKTVSKYGGPAGLLVAGSVLVLIGRQPHRTHETWVDEAAWLRRVRLLSRAREINNIAAQAVLGEVVLSLTNASLAWGGAELHATVWLGRVLVVCPAGWRVVPTSPVGHVGSLEIDIPPVPPDLRTGQAVTLQLHLMGARGSLIVLWRDAPVTALAPLEPEASVEPATGLIETEDGHS